MNNLEKYFKLLDEKKSKEISYYRNIMYIISSFFLFSFIDSSLSELKYVYILNILNILLFIFSAYKLFIFVFYYHINCYMYILINYMDIELYKLESYFLTKNGFKELFEYKNKNELFEKYKKIKGSSIFDELLKNSFIENKEFLDIKNNSKLTIVNN